MSRKGHGSPGRRPGEVWGLFLREGTDPVVRPDCRRGGSGTGGRAMLMFWTVLFAAGVVGCSFVHGLSMRGRAPGAVWPELIFVLCGFLALAGFIGAVVTAF